MRHPRPALALLALTAALLTGCALQPKPAPVLAPAPLAEADALIGGLVDQKLLPGAVLWVEREGRAPYHRAYGQRALQPAPEPQGEDTVFDAASLTKPVVTATLVQILRERGRLDVEAPLQRYLPDCGGADKAGITLRQLLTHTSGLPATLKGNGAGEWRGIAAAREQACALPLQGTPGGQFRYSDVNYILLGIIVAQQAGEPLEQFADEALFKPLGMKDSGYLPLRRLPLARIAPTEREPDGHLLRGEVHDPTARKMGGVSGNAGLFTTTADLARFARMLLAGGVAEDGRRLLSPESVRLLSTPQQPAALKELRSLGWDLDTPYSSPRGTLFPVGASFGHTGFTGCILWLDPQSRSFYVFLSNRVHPGPPTVILPAYGPLGTLMARAVGLGAD